MRTAYLSLTRGEGGQNLIGSEQGDELGIIRTQELLAARRIDGAEQYFTRAIDFGFSKTAGRNLRQMAARPSSRRYRLEHPPLPARCDHPAISPARRATAMASIRCRRFSGSEAFSAAADPVRYPGATAMGPALAGEAADVQRHRLHGGAGEAKPAENGRSHRDRSGRVQSRARLFLRRNRRHEPQPASQPGHGRAANKKAR